MAIRACGLMAMGTPPLGPALLRVHDGQSRTAGAAFWVSPDEAITCAHVVCRALGLPDDTAEAPTGTVRVEAPLAGGGPLEASVARWVPLGSGTGDDLAVLRVSAPSGSAPLRLVPVGDPWGHTVHTLGFPPGNDGGVFADGTLRGEQGNRWVQINNAQFEGHPIEVGFSGAPVWDETAGRVIGLVVAADAAPKNRSAYMVPALVVAEHWPDLVSTGRGPCPYLGLRSFGEDDTGLFFGRGNVTGRLAATVRRRAATLVVGPSGCGKSSLLNAGLKARLRADDRYAIAAFRPSVTADPWASLALALLPLLEPDADEVTRISQSRRLGGELANGAVTDTVARVCELTGSPELLVVIDQYEAVLPDDPDAPADDAAVACAAIVAAFAAADQARVVVGLRSDFLDRALRQPELSAAVSDGIFAVTPMTRDELHAAVVEPLTGTGVAAEPGLAERIIADLDAPDQLALLEFTLTELWTSESSGSLSHDAYAELGGVDGALTRYADGVYAALDPAEQETARWLLLQLVRPAEETHSPVRTTARRADLAEDAWRLATTKLVPARLLVADRDATGAETVELAHEALAGHWRRLRDWLEEDGRFRDWRERLRAAIARWETGGRADSLLLTRAELAAAEEHLPARRSDLSAAEGSYVDDSRTHLRRGVRIRRGLFGIAATGVAVVLVLGTLFAYQSYQTDQQRALAAARSLATQSQQAMSDAAGQGTLLALAAYRTAPGSIEARRALFGAYERIKLFDRAIFLDDPSHPPMTTDADGDVAAAISTDEKNLLVWHVDAAHQTTIPLTWSTSVPDRYPNGAVSVSSDGRRIAVAVNGAVAVYDTARGRLLWKFQAADRGLEVRPAFVPGGPELYAMTYPDDVDHPEHSTLVRMNTATGRMDRSIPLPHRVWELIGKSGETPTWYPLADGVTMLGDSTGSYPSDEKYLTWNIATGHVERSAKGQVDPDGRHLLTTAPAKNGTVELTLRRATDRRPLATVDVTDNFGLSPETPSEFDENAVLSPDGRYAAAFDENGNAAIVDFNRRRVAAYARTGSTDSNLLRLAAIPGGGFRLTLSSTSDGKLRRQIVRPETFSTSGTRQDAVTISPDGHYTASYDDVATGDLDLWDVHSGKHIARTALPPSSAQTSAATSTLVFSRDGRHLAALTDDWRRLDVWDVPSLARRAVINLDRPGQPNSAGDLDAGPWFDAHGAVNLAADGLVSRWDARTGRPLGTWNLARAAGLAGESRLIAPVPGGDRVAVAAQRGRAIGLWDLGRRRRIASIPYRSGDITDLAISSDERHIATITGNGTGIQLLTRPGDRWSIPQAVPVPGGTDNLSHIGFLPHPLRLFANGGTYVWRIGDDGTAEQTQDLSASSTTITPGGVSDDGTMVTVGDYEVPSVIIPGSPERWRDHICAAIGAPDAVPASLRPALPQYTQATGLCP